MCVCVQLIPTVQNTLGHDQTPAVPEPGLHKDELDSYLGDVSEAHLHVYEYNDGYYRHKMSLLLSCPLYAVIFNLPKQYISILICLFF